MSEAPEHEKFVDLQEDEIGALIDDALAREQAEKLRQRMGPLLESAPPQTRDLVLGLVSVIGALSAQVSILSQSVDQSYKTRAERIRLDPLPFIPQERLTPAIKPNASQVILVGSHGFTGTGWHAPETNGTNFWCWSGAAPNATLLMPTLGGGKLKLLFDMLMPFGRSFDEAAITVLVNDTPITLSASPVKGNGKVYVGEVDLPEDQGLGSFVLVLQSVAFRAPSESREQRTLGVGLYAVMVKKVSA